MPNKFELFWCTSLGQKIRNSKNNNVSQRPAKHSEAPRAQQVESGSPYPGRDSVKQVVHPVPSPAWWEGVGRVQLLPMVSCLNLSSLGPDWPFVVRSFFGGAETTVFPNTESQAWGVPYIWTSCSRDSYRPGNLGGSFESYKLNATEKSLREHQIQSPSSFLTLRPGVAQWLNHLRQRQD